MEQTTYPDGIPGNTLNPNGRGNMLVFFVLHFVYCNLELDMDSSRELEYTFFVYELCLVLQEIEFCSFCHRNIVSRHCLLLSCIISAHGLSL